MMMICPRCKSTSNPEGTRYCLECGAELPAAPEPAAAPAPPANATQPPPAYAPPPGYAPMRSMTPSESKTSGLAIASLILGILSPCTACVSGLVGIILGIVAITQINQPRSGLKGSGLAYAGIITAIVLPLVLAAALYPLFTKTKNMVQGPVMANICLQNERQIAQAAQMYAQDHEGMLPTPDQLIASDYCTSDVYLCPSQLDAPIGYGLYQSVAGQKWDNLSDPRATPLLADGGNASHLIVSDADIAKRHMGGYNQAFLDGHAAANGYDPSEGLPEGAVLPDTTPPASDNSGL
ncbi:MAG: DUF4190 domain-containing protein [Armatimonadota bacterium]